MIDDGNELVSAPTAHDIVWAEDSFQCAGDNRKCTVTNVMTVLVIDCLELVHINDQ
jgi:hypothetical protein